MHTIKNNAVLLSIPFSYLAVLNELPHSKRFRQRVYRHHRLLSRLFSRFIILRKDVSLRPRLNADTWAANIRRTTRQAINDPFDNNDILLLICNIDSSYLDR